MRFSLICAIALLPASSLASTGVVCPIEDGMNSVVQTNPELSKAKFCSDKNGQRLCAIREMRMEGQTMIFSQMDSSGLPVMTGIISFRGEVGTFNANWLVRRTGTYKRTSHKVHECDEVPDEMVWRPKGDGRIEFSEGPINQPIATPPHPTSVTPTKQETPDYGACTAHHRVAVIPPLANKPYAEARELLFQAGWQPKRMRWQDVDKLSANAREVYDVGFQEVDDCSGTGLGYCSFNYIDTWGNKLNVVTIGEVHRVGDKIVSPVMNKTEATCMSLSQPVKNKTLPPQEGTKTGDKVDNDKKLAASAAFGKLIEPTIVLQKLWSCSITHTFFTNIEFTPLNDRATVVSLCGKIPKDQKKTCMEFGAELDRSDAFYSIVISSSPQLKIDGIFTVREGASNFRIAFTEKGVRGDPVDMHTSCRASR